MLVPAALQANVTRGGAMTATENIFLAWALFSGGVTLLAVLLILLFNATKHRRIQQGTGCHATNHHNDKPC